MKSSNFRKGHLLLLLICSLRAVAGSQEDGFTLGSLEKIQEETLFDQARLESVRARNELDKYRQTAEPQPAADPAVPAGHPLTGMSGEAADAPAPVSTPAEITDPGEATLPAVIQIWGNRRHLNAQLQMPDGKRVTVAENTVLPGNRYRIIAITPREVRVSNGYGSPKNLAFIGGSDD